MHAPRLPVAALAVTTTAGYGVLFYAYGVLLVPMQQDLRWSRSFLSGAFSLALLVAAFLTIPVGRWLDRHQPRGLFLAGALAAAVFTGAWALATNRLVFVGIWLLLGACQSVLFYEPAFTVLTKWFQGLERHRALTTVTLVAGLASTIFGPLTSALERTLGWRGAVLVLDGILAAVTIPCLAIGLGHRARAGDSAIAEEDAPAEVSTIASEALRSADFWILTTAYVLSAMTTFAVAVHLVAYLRSRGVASGLAALTLGAIGLVQVAGRSAFLRMSAARPSVQLGTWVLLAKAVGLAVLVAVPSTSGVVTFVLVYGSSNGVATLTRATTVGELYGPAHYGAISSVIAAVAALGGALAPFAVAVVSDLAGSDTPAFAGLVGLSVLAAAANQIVARRFRPPLASAATAADMPVGGPS